MKLKLTQLMSTFFEYIGMATTLVFVLIFIFGGKIQIKINFESFTELINSLFK